MRVCHGYLSRKGKRHSNPLFTLHNAGTAHVGPAEIANKKRGAMEKTKKQENDLTNRSPLQSPFSQQGRDVGGMLTLQL